MRKIFLTAIAVLSIATTQVFGMYGVDTDWIFFLTHGNQFRARLDQLGFTLGNDTIKGTFGFDNNAGYGGVYGSMLSHANAGAGIQIFQLESATLLPQSAWAWDITPQSEISGKELTEKITDKPLTLPFWF